MRTEQFILTVECANKDMPASAMVERIREMIEVGIQDDYELAAEDIQLEEY